MDQLQRASLFEKAFLFITYYMQNTLQKKALRAFRVELSKSQFKKMRQSCYTGRLAATCFEAIAYI